MLRSVAMTLLVLGSGAIGVAAAAEPKETGKTMEATGTASETAKQRAVQTLAQQLGVTETDIAVTSIEPHTWSDSSMGCGKRGTMALQVITEGYVVSLTAQGTQHEVHVSGKTALVCDKPVLARKELRRPASGRGLEIAIEKAREDLAQRLGVESSKVLFTGTRPHQWANNGLGCPLSGESIVDRPVTGHVLTLKYGSRTYTYHTDLKGVRPCPAIEAD